MTEALPALRTIIPLAFTSGINLYLTILVVGLSIRFGWVPSYPPGLEALASLPVLIGAGVFYVIEFFADKIAFVDNLWDLIHTLIRPIGAVLIASASVAGVDPSLVETSADVIGVSPQVGLFASLFAGVVALVSHGGKAGTRTALNVTSPAETLSNIAVSLLEDLAVALIAFLALRFPLAANLIAATLLLLIIIFVPQLLRWAWFTLKAIFARLRALVRPRQQSDPLPASQQALLGDRPIELSAHCQAQNVRGANGRYGYLVLSGTQLLFTYKAWWRNRVWSLDIAAISNVQLRQGFLADVLEIAHDDSGKLRLARFAFTSDRRALATQFATGLGARPAASRSATT